MQSSTIMAVRVFVMLACMVALPVLAIFGTSWMNLGLAGVTPQAKLLQTSLTHAPVTYAQTAGAALQPLESHLSPGAARIALSEVEPNNSIYPPASADSWPSVAAAAQTVEGAAGPANNSTSPQLPAHSGARGIPSRQHGQPRPLAAQTAWPTTEITAPQNARPDAVPAGYTAPASSTRPAEDWFTGVQQRLRELGATYYLLETWGRNGELYRFQCQMAVVGSPNSPRHFEATDAAPERAMQAVLNDVEAWRRGR